MPKYIQFTPSQQATIKRVVSSDLTYREMEAELRKAGITKVTGEPVDRSFVSNHRNKHVGSGAVKAQAKKAIKRRASGPKTMVKKAGVKSETSALLAAVFSSDIAQHFKTKILETFTA